MDENTNQRIYDLREVAEYHYQRIDAAIERGDEMDAATHKRMATAVERMISDEQGRLDRLQSQAARRAAEHRLAYHAEHDTLDLY